MSLWAATTWADGTPVGDSLKALALIGLNVKEHHLSTLDACTTAKEAAIEEGAEKPEERHV
jgi:hypothetical protein